MLISFFRTLLLYAALILSIRLMGKRQIGQLEASEFVVTMLVANLASIPMQDVAVPLYTGLVPILTVLGAELVLSGLILRSVVLRRLLCGKPVILIENGHILTENLRSTRVTLDELTGHLRQKDVLDIRTVQYAILETDGSLSVFPYPGYCPPDARTLGVEAQEQFLPFTIIEDGYLSRSNLRKSGKDKAWLERMLRKRKTPQANVLLLSVDEGDNVIFYKKEPRP